MNAALSQQLQLEAAFLQQQNLQHQAACSELAFQLTHTQTLLQVRSAELLSRRKHADTEGRAGELRKREEKLEKEGERLRERAKSLGEGSKLQAEISQTKELQRLYLDKLAELRERWPGYDPKDSKLSDIRDELQSATKERDYFRDTVVPVLKQTLDLFEQHKHNLLSELEELKETVPPLQPLSPLGAAVRAMGMSPRTSVGLSQKTASQSSSKTAKSSYSPSFLRTRKSTLKVKIRRDVHVQEIEETDEFADVFPEENELVPSA